MPKIMNAANVQEAVEMGQALKAQGEYNWFRGQVKDWPPVSSLHRIYRDGDDAAAERTRMRFFLFSKWISKNPKLSHLLSDESTHQFFAIAQHYGVATDYIDFTTDPAVAGFFAADTKTPPTEGMSCIFCLNTQDLLRIFQLVKSVSEERDEALIEAIEVDVANLWRLHAQRGTFLFSNYNWDIDYPMDRILFPYTGYPSYPLREHIYPKEKSALELELDQYFFAVESQHFGHERIKQMVKDQRAKGGHAEIAYMSRPPNGIYEKAFLDPTNLVPLRSWTRAQEPVWQVYPDEHYHEVRGRIERLHLTAADRLQLERAVAFGVKQVLDANPNLRQKLVEWAVDGSPGKVPAQRLSAMFGEAWDGMRSLPFTNTQIASAFSTIAGMAFLDFGSARERKDEADRFRQVRGEGLRVEIAYADNASSIGYVKETALRKAMRTDLKSLLTPEFCERVDDWSILFQLIQNPTILFDFDPLVEIFAADLIPSQILLGRKPTLFNPAALTSFGFH